jgi:hypothetical protein
VTNAAAAAAAGEGVVVVKVETKNGFVRGHNLWKPPYEEILDQRSSFVSISYQVLHDSCKIGRRMKKKM